MDGSRNFGADWLSLRLLNFEIDWLFLLPIIDSGIRVLNTFDADWQILVLANDEKLSN